MQINISKDANSLGQEAAHKAKELILQQIELENEVNIILATGASQFSVLEHLIAAEIDWSKVTMFHLDEYIGLAEDHDASFRKYLRNRFLKPVDYQCRYHLIDGNVPNPQEECDRVSAIIEKHPIHVALIGIGENGHLAFNDPPADFETEEPYIVVELDHACRKQQMGEGWFPTIDDVPEQAISMSIQQILKSKHLIVSVPDKRKAEAVKCAVEGPLTNECPASILRTHPNCSLYLDEESASLLTKDRM